MKTFVFDTISEAQAKMLELKSSGKMFVSSKTEDGKFAVTEVEKRTKPELNKSK